MKTLAACLLALTVVSCDAQSQRAATAFSLYSACLKGTLMGGLNSNTFPRTPQEIDEFIEEIDNNCVGWTAAWYPAFGTGISPDIYHFNEIEVSQFNKLRYNLLGQMKSTFDDELKKKK